MSDAQILQLLGLIYVATGLGWVVSPKQAKAMLRGLFDTPAATWCFGLLGAVVGYLLITRQTGNEGWSLLVTVIGWIALVKGLVGLAVPQVFDTMGKKILESNVLLKLSAWVALGGGILMLYVGFAVL